LNVFSFFRILDNGMTGANIDTPRAAVLPVDAFGIAKQHVLLDAHSLGIRTPLAMKGTTFHKNKGSTTRPIMHGVPLNIENEPFYFIFHPVLLVFS
jgi:hypothetical protein